jgi:hypothetical protein
LDVAQSSQFKNIRQPAHAVNMFTERQRVVADDAEALDIDIDRADTDLVDRQFSSLPCPDADNDHFGLVGVHRNHIQIEPAAYGANTYIVGEVDSVVLSFSGMYVKLRVVSVLVRDQHQKSRSRG